MRKTYHHPNSHFLSSSLFLDRVVEHYVEKNLYGEWSKHNYFSETTKRRDVEGKDTHHSLEGHQ